MPLPKITEDIVREIDKGLSYAKGYDYFKSGAVRKVWIENGSYKADVQGSELYTVTVSEVGGRIAADCTCPYDWGGVCKHIVAAMLHIVETGKAGEHQDKMTGVKELLETVEPYRLKKFLLDVLGGNEKLLEDFRIFAAGTKETGITSDRYKEEILSEFDGLDEKTYYYDHEYDRYEDPVSEIITEFTDTASKYAKQGNIGEAVKTYQGICDACCETITEDRLDDFSDDMYYHAKESLQSIAGLLSTHEEAERYKIPCLTYFLEKYEFFEHGTFFEEIFKKTVTTSQEADFVLEKGEPRLTPPLIFILLLVKDELDVVASFGEKYWQDYTRMALPLSGFYLRHGLRDKAVSTAEKAVEATQDSRKNSSYDRETKELREFLHRCYNPESDYGKVIENLIMLVKITRDADWYKKLREIVRTEGEKETILNRLEAMLNKDYDTLFKIYSMESDHVRLLKLAGDSINYPVFDHIVKNIRDRYPNECLDLYEKKIDSATKEVGSRSSYQQIAHWLKLMKEIPGHKDRFRQYIEHLKVEYKKRRAFLEEIRGI